MKYVIGIIVVIVVLVGGYFFFTSSQENGAQPLHSMLNADPNNGLNPPSTTTDQTGAGNTSASVEASVTAPATVVTYTDSGFSPSSITIKVGQSVTFMNSSSGGMWIASNPHPTHQGYDGTTESVHCAPGYTGPAPFDQCANGNSFTFVFNKIGTWGYHNHEGAENTGTVVVTQ